MKSAIRSKGSEKKHHQSLIESPRSSKNAHRAKEAVKSESKKSNTVTPKRKTPQKERKSLELTKSTSSAVSSHSNGKGREKYEETTANRTPSRDYHHPLQPRIYPSYIAPSVAVTDPAYGYLPPPPAPSQAFPSPYPVPPYSMYPNYFYNQMNPMYWPNPPALYHPNPPVPPPSQYYPGSNRVSAYKMAIHQSLEESAMDEKLRKADEEALQRALQLSLDEQDQRYTSFDKADSEAVEGALLRSVYDKGGSESGAETIDTERDEQLERKLAMERANEAALDSGVIRSIYDVRSGSSDSGVAVALSSGSGYPLAVSADDEELVMPIEEEEDEEEAGDDISLLHPKEGFQPRFDRSFHEEKENY